jgi:hypothetical protein
MDNLAVKLNITSPEDWYRITGLKVREEGGFFMKYYNGSLHRGTKKRNEIVLEINVNTVEAEFGFYCVDIDL